MGWMDGWIYLRSLVLKEHRQSDANKIKSVELYLPKLHFRGVLPTLSQHGKSESKHLFLFCTQSLIVVTPFSANKTMVRQFHLGQYRTRTYLNFGIQN